MFSVDEWLSGCEGLYEFFHCFGFGGEFIKLVKADSAPKHSVCDDTFIFKNLQVFTCLDIVCSYLASDFRGA